jgi:RsiW-degrading membrane proteinase PrsW (M82 family)
MQMNSNPYPNPAYATMAATVTIKPSNNRRAMKWVLGIAGLLVAALLGLLTFLLISLSLLGQGGDAGPIGIIVGLLMATIPVPFYIMIILWIDRYESEPLWMLATAFIWGATVAAFLGFLINTALGAIVTAVTDAQTGAAVGATFIAPVVEETAKGLILFVFFFWKKDEFDGVIDGIVYASMVALGFAMTENIMYYGRAAIGGGVAGGTVIFILRGLMAPFSHPLFTSMTGIGLGLSRTSRNTFVKIAAPIVGLGLAMLMHLTWNGSATFGGTLGFFITYFVVMVPVFLVALVAIFFALRREGQIVREFLLVDCNSGLFSQEEYDRLCSVRGRMGSSFRALTKGGVAAWRTRMQWHQTASELAFHRSRTARGIIGRDMSPREREVAYQMALEELRRRITT